MDIASGTWVYMSLTATNGAGLTRTVDADPVLVVYDPPIAQGIADGLDLANDVRVMNSSVVSVIWEPFQRRHVDITGYVPARAASRRGAGHTPVHVCAATARLLA